MEFGSNILQVVHTVRLYVAFSMGSVFKAMLYFLSYFPSKPESAKIILYKQMIKMDTKFDTFV